MYKLGLVTCLLSSVHYKLIVILFAVEKLPLETLPLEILTHSKLGWLYIFCLELSS